MDVVIPAAAEITVVYRSKQKATEQAVVTTSMEAFRSVFGGFDRDTIALQEQFVALYLNRANRVLGLYRVATGGQTSVVADPRLILGAALRIAAVSLVVAHNHPSGILKPSRQDEELTQRLKEGGRFLDVKLLDHLIVSPCGEGYLSFADEGWL